MPQQLGHIVHALLFEGGEQTHFATARIELGDGQNLGLLGAGQLVGLGQHDEKLQALLHARADGIQQGFVEFGEAQARVAQQHHGGEAFAAHQIVEHDALPALLVGAGDSCVAVAGQVGQHGIGHALLAQRKQVDVLGAAGLLGSESQLLLLGQGVDGGGLAGVGAANEGNLGNVDFGQLVELGRGREKTRGVHPAHRKLAVDQRKCFSGSGIRGSMGHDGNYFREAHCRI